MRILVTAGPTREFFDSVRFISNPASGKLGYAIAAAALQRGHEVVLISGPVSLPAPEGARVIHVVSAREMFEAATSAFAECQAAVMTAAVCDYRPSRRLSHKLKKQPRPRTIQLQPTEDICAHLGRAKGRRLVIGFAMEDHDDHANAERKLRSKRCDAMVLNSIANIAGDAAEVEILRADSGWSGPRAGTKAQLGAVVVDLVEELASTRA
jgi:phosphopantothenoylcysteine decarboxylase/phosphopantothenate--cysteine ligase